jgi:hypothetical protein
MKSNSVVARSTQSLTAGPALLDFGAEHLDSVLRIPWLKISRSQKSEATSYRIDSGISALSMDLNCHSLPSELHHRRRLTFKN